MHKCLGTHFGKLLTLWKCLSGSHEPTIMLYSGVMITIYIVECDSLEIFQKLWAPQTWIFLDIIHVTFWEVVDPLKVLIAKPWKKHYAILKSLDHHFIVECDSFRRFSIYIMRDDVKLSFLLHLFSLFFKSLLSQRTTCWSSRCWWIIYWYKIRDGLCWN